MLIRAQEMARYVADGVLDAGLTGQDWIAEQARPRSPMPPGGGSRADRRSHLREAELRPREVGARGAGGLAVQAAQDLEGQDGRDRAGPGDRSVLPAALGVNVNVEFSWGATEVKPPVLADAIVEVTETGSSLRANRLRIIDTVMESNTQLIREPRRARRSLEEDQDRQPRAAAPRGHRSAGPRRADAQRPARGPRGRCLALLPALQRPTISPLSDADWVAVNTIIEERTVRDLIPRLKAARARASSNTR